MADISVIVVDDERVVRDGLAMILSAHAGIAVVATAADGSEALRLCRAHRPDVLLTDVRMPGMDGLELLGRLAHLDPPRPRVLVLTAFEHDDYVASALAAGASGFLLKSSPQEQIADAVRAAAEGRTTLSDSVLASVIGGYLAERSAGPDEHDRAVLAALTPRELDVLRLIGEGASNADIAGALTLSLHTVKTHVRRILEKTGTTSRTQAAALAVRCRGSL